MNLEKTGYREVIVDGTRRLVEAAEKAGVKSLIFLSSVKAMGEGDLIRRLISENEANSPRTPYGRCKLEAEKIVLASRIPHVVVLPSGFQTAYCWRAQKPATCWATCCVEGCHSIQIP